MFLLKRLLVTATILLVVGCSGKNISLHTNISYSDFLSKVETVNSPVRCAYNGKVAVTIDYEGEKTSFTALMSKGCNDEAQFSIFGAFNTIFAEIDYINGEAFVRAKDNATQEAILTFAVPILQALINSITSPAYLPDDEAPITFQKEFYVYNQDYSLNSGAIFFDENFRIVKVEFNSPKNSVAKGLVIDYAFKDGEVSNIKFSMTDGSILMKFLDPTRWKTW